MVDYARALAESQLKSELDVRFAEVSLAEARLLLESASNDRRVADAELSPRLAIPIRGGFNWWRSRRASCLPPIRRA